MSEETIFREVDEELRRDQLRTAWRRFGPWVIAAAVVAVLGVAANEGWTWWKGSNAARSSDQFYAALDLEHAGDPAGAAKALDTVVAQGSGQYPELAKFLQAGLMVKQGNAGYALAAYDAIANAQGDQRLKEVALLLGASILVDKGDVQGVKQRVVGLLTADNPLRNSAQEMIGLAQYKAGDLNGARDSFSAILADPLSTDQARSRMELYIAQLVAQGATPPPVTGTAGNATDAAAAALSALSGPVAAPSGVAKLPDAGASGTAPGVSSSQSATPDSSLQLAVPAPAAAPADGADTGLSTGAGLPSLPATGDQTAPAAPADSSAAPAATPADSTAAPAPAAPATTPAPAASSTAPATSDGAAKPAAPANDNAAPATTPASGTTGQ